MAKLFGTDGVRGQAGSVLTAELAMKLGQAAGRVFLEENGGKTGVIIVGRDTRISGQMLECALTAGLTSVGIQVISAGVVPTPAVAFLVRKFKALAGAVISASHNPFEDNGIKFFSASGSKLRDDQEAAIEAALQGEVEITEASGRNIGRYAQVAEAIDAYTDYLDELMSVNGRDYHIVVDCANGAASYIAEKVFTRANFNVTMIGDRPNGTNINVNCGSTHLAQLQQRVLEEGADAGLAFDGDGDRLGVVTKSGEIIYPDRQMMLFAKDILAHHPGAQIVYDVKCTRRLVPWIEACGGVPTISCTGHSLVKAKLRETGAPFAGEMSGHLFFNDGRWPGFDDGVYAGARILEILSREADPSAALEALPSAVNTPELQIRMAEGENKAFIARLQKEARFDDALDVITIDGVRVEWNDGFALARSSNTTPVVVLRLEGDTPEALERIKKTFAEVLLKVEPSLELPF